MSSLENQIFIVKPKTRLQSYMESYEKIFSHEKFELLPDRMKKGLTHIHKMTVDRLTFYEEVKHLAYERKVLACKKIFLDVIENKLFRSSENYFFYYLFSGMGIFPSKKLYENDGTAAVVYSQKYNNRYMIYNPDFILYTYRISGIEGLSFLIKHEMSHIVLGHIEYRRASTNFNNLLEDTNTLLNIAQDLAINSILIKDNLTLRTISNGVFPTIFPYDDFPPDLSAEEYLHLLRQKDKDYLTVCQMHYDSSSAGSHNFDDEEVIDEIQDYECNRGGGKNNKSRVLMEKIYDYNKIQDAAHSSKGCSGASSTLINLFIKNIGVNINPHDIFRFFLQQAEIINGKESSSRRVNKKNPYNMPGKKFIRESEIAFYCDMSGSVSDELLGQFFDVVMQCAESGRTFIFIPFTTEIDEAGIVTITANEPPTLRTVSGGTDFSCVNKHAIENGFTGVCVLTDMEAPYPGELGIPRLWVTDTKMEEFNGESVLSFTKE
jgi:predicted metal-dependent peptidase